MQTSRALTESSPTIELQPARAATDLAVVRQLLEEYAITLGSHPAALELSEELTRLPGDYADPRGCLLLAHVDGTPAGCCALRPLDTVDYPNAAEMRRLYVRRMFRGFGLGRQLAEAILDAARQRGYASVLLDTNDEMDAARSLYADLGFEIIEPYHYSSTAGAHHLKVDID